MIKICTNLIEGVKVSQFGRVFLPFFVSFFFFRGEIFPFEFSHFFGHFLDKNVRLILTPEENTKLCTKCWSDPLSKTTRELLKDFWHGSEVHIVVWPKSSAHLLYYDYDHHEESTRRPTCTSFHECCLPPPTRCFYNWSNKKKIMWELISEFQMEKFGNH